MTSASTLSCYSALSVRILITNRLITFLMLRSRYPVVQPINLLLLNRSHLCTPMFRVCALLCPHIASPLLYRDCLRVFPISCNCLAPPHFPESPHRMFIPQCIYCPHNHLLIARSLLCCTFFILYSCLIPEILSGSCFSPVILSSLVSPVNCCCFIRFHVAALLLMLRFCLVPVSLRLFCPVSCFSPVVLSSLVSPVSCCFVVFL